MAESDKSKGEPKVIKKGKKKGGEHGHHGGAWKVAFADFMTAMMALFLVLWIMSQSQEVKQAVAYFFRHATEYEGNPDAALRGNDGFMDVKNGRLDTPPSMKEGKGADGLPGGHAGKPTTALAGGAAISSSEPGLRPLVPIDKSDGLLPDEEREFVKITESLWTDMGMDPGFEKIKDQVYMEPVQEGLLIQFLELPDAPLLDQKSEKFVPQIRQAMAALAGRIAALRQNKVEIDGHGLGMARSADQKWVGSFLLADLARRELLESGVLPGQITKVASMADTRPLYPDKPSESLNRRVSILVHPKNWQPKHF
jgi:chemotaxis protein MotB